MRWKRAVISAGILSQSMHVSARVINGVYPRGPQAGEAAPQQVDAKAMKAAENCGGTDWLVTPDNWKKHNTDEWLKNWWESEGKGTGLTFLKAFEQKWLTKLGGRLNCGQGLPCAAPSCDGVVDPNTLKQALEAFYVTHSIVNFNNWLYYANSKVNEAQLTQNSMDVKMVNTFSSQRAPPPNQQSPLELFMRLTSAIVGGLGLIPGLSAPAAIVGTGLTFISLGIPKPGEAPTKVPSQLDKVGDLGAYLADFADKMRGALNDYMKQGFSGTADAAGNDILSIFKDGSMLLWERQEDALAAYYSKQIRGRCLNQLMVSDSTYIVKAPAQGGNCNNDQGLNENMKYCDPDDMSNAYHIYQWDLNAGEFPPLRAPRGWDLLSSVLGIDLKTDIMASSVASYKAGGNSYSTEVGNQPVLPPRDKPELSTAGAFSIPICVSADGTASSKYDTDNYDDGLRYPCRCGNDKSWNGARSFTVGDDQAIQLPDKPETRQFWHYARLDWQDWYSTDRDSRYSIEKFCQDEQKDSFFFFNQLYTGKFKPMWPGAPSAGGWGGDSFYQNSGTPNPPARAA